MLDSLWCRKRIRFFKKPFYCEQCILCRVFLTTFLSLSGYSANCQFSEVLPQNSVRNWSVWQRRLQCRVALTSFPCQSRCSSCESFHVTVIQMHQRSYFYIISLFTTKEGDWIMTGIEIWFVRKFVSGVKRTSWTSSPVDVEVWLLAWVLVKTSIL